MRVLRNILVAFFLMPVVFSEAAKYPQFLRLQGRFTDNKIPLNDTLPVRFSVWDTEDGYGNLLWEEVQNVSIQNNAFQVVLGRSKPLTPSVFSGGDRWVELQVGNDAPLRPRHWIPNQYIQAQVAAAQAAPAPAGDSSAPGSGGAYTRCGAAAERPGAQGFGAADRTNIKKPSRA